MFRDILIFIRRHWPHLLLMVPGAIAVTIVHEGAHAAAVLIQGGALSRFVWLPGGGHWGYVSYEFPVGVPHSPFLISIAPYLLWLLLAVLASALSARRAKMTYWKASLLYFWLYVVPLGDIANTAFPYLTGQNNDFLHAFGQPTISMGLMIGLLCVFAVICGYHVQRQLYREDGLRVSSYLTLSTLVLLMLTALTTGNLIAG